MSDLFPLLDVCQLSRVWTFYVLMIFLSLGFFFSALILREFLFYFALVFAVLSLALCTLCAVSYYVYFSAHLLCFVTAIVFLRFKRILRVAFRFCILYCIP